MEKKNFFKWLAMVWYFVMAVTAPISVYLWISNRNSAFEWIAVCALFAYFVPFVFEFATMKREGEYD